MVITGAGISTSLGIPDFRSRNTGFYSQLLARGFESPEDVFDIHNFDNDPTYAFIAQRET
jgi:NAD-dependent histone deacetylase SIR2